MSRIGKIPVAVPSGVTVTAVSGVVEVKGEKGALRLKLPKFIDIKIQKNSILVKRENDTKQAKSNHGLARALINNMVTGVSKGFEKKLELVGIGFRAVLEGENLILNVGFSHPVTVKAPEGIKFTVNKNVITVSGCDKQLVGEISSQIRKVKKPEPYKGKGIKYIDERVKRKPGKAVKTAEGA